jgi:hypothetical protein
MEGMRASGRIVALVTLLLLAVAPREARAYSVLAHEANIDALWESGIRPLLERRFPRASPEQLREARSYAYGGSVIQDLGYYPFGSHFFSNLLHYVRTGDFVETMIRGARDLNEVAFALGALGHYAADNTGHPDAVNRAVAMMFPKLRAKYGNSVTYVDSPAKHVLVELSFDIVQAAKGAYVPESYHSFIGFQVAKPLLDRAFKETYGLEMSDVFGDEDLAIATYRKSVSTIIPELTRVAWREKHDEIARITPGVKERDVVFRYSRRDYEREFGKNYKRPGPFAWLLGVAYRIVPKVGPLKPLSFKTPTPEAEALFVESLKDTRARFGALLDALARSRLDLANTNFDTGRPVARGSYALADETYAELLDRIADREFAGVPAALKANISRYYAARSTAPGHQDPKHAGRIRKQLAGLNASR